MINCVSTLSVWRIVETVEPVANMELIVEPLHASTMDANGIIVNVVIEKGTDVSFLINFGDLSDTDDDVMTPVARTGACSFISSSVFSKFSYRII